MSVTLDGIENTALIFVGVAFIANPRAGRRDPSEILLDILARLREAGIRWSSRRRSVPHEAGQGPAIRTRRSRS